MRLASQKANQNPRFQAARVLFAMVMREMNTRYGRTWGGYMWAILDPVGMIALLTLAFSQFIHAPPIGTSFELFYATGYIPFYIYSEITNNTSMAVAFNKQLMHFPAITPLDAVIARFILSVLTLLVVSVIVFFAIAFVSEWSGALDLGAIVLATGLAALLGLGLGTMNCVLFAFFPVWQRVWMVLSRPLFLVSGVFFTYESMPPQIQTILWYNPLVHIIGVMRRGFYASYNADFASVFYVGGIGVGSLVLGSALLIRHKSYVIES